MRIADALGLRALQQPHEGLLHDVGSLLSTHARPREHPEVVGVAGEKPVEKM